MKIWAYVAIGTMALGASWFLYDLITDRERLQSNVATLEESNVAYLAVIEKLQLDKIEKDKAIMARNRKINDLNKTLLRAKDEVRKVTNELVTEQERECLLAAVPDAIIDFMFSEGEADIDTDDGASLSGDSFVYAYASPGVRGPDVGGLGILCETAPCPH